MTQVNAADGNGRKLSVLCLHGTTMCGDSMRKMLRWKECGIEMGCDDIATFYYPTGPCVVAKNHAIWKSAPESLPPGPDKRHWWTMKNKWDFSEKGFAEARKVLTAFVDKEVGGPIDVILGFSQGAAACTQILNDVMKEKVQNNHLKCTRGAIFIGCPEVPGATKQTGERIKSLHCNGKTDKLVSVGTAKKHAKAFKDDTFFEFEGGHAPTGCFCVPPIRDFLLSLRSGASS